MHLKFRLFRKLNLERLCCSCTCQGVREALLQLIQLGLQQFLNWNYTKSKQNSTKSGQKSTPPKNSLCAASRKVSRESTSLVSTSLPMLFKVSVGSAEFPVFVSQTSWNKVFPISSLSNALFECPKLHMQHMICYSILFKLTNHYLWFVDFGYIFLLNTLPIRNNRASSEPNTSGDASCTKTNNTNDCQWNVKKHCAFISAFRYTKYANEWYQQRESENIL